MGRRQPAKDAREQTDERAAAREYWGATTAQQKEYTRPRFHSWALTHVIRQLRPRSVLEMGCNAGRNLQELRRVLPAGTSLRGFDVNAESIAFGKREWNLALEVADETFLERQPAGSADVVFTVSVLDHLPAIDRVLREIARVSARHYVAIEPFPEESLRYLETLKRSGRVRREVTTTTPYSYLHPYGELVPRAGLRPRLALPMPPYLERWGPLYRLTVYEKTESLRTRLRSALGPRTGGDAPKPFRAWKRLHDEIVFEAIAWTLGRSRGSAER